jgi:hypothetical protein
VPPRPAELKLYFLRLQVPQVNDFLTMVVGPGDILSVISLAIQLGQIIEEAYAFSGECQKLGILCRTIQGILEEHKSSIVPTAVSELHRELEDCERYLTSCAKHRLKRNPIWEGAFSRKISKFRDRLDTWIGVTNLSLLVTPRLK